MANTLQWRPGFWTEFDENGNLLRESQYIRFATYRELKKNIKKFFHSDRQTTIYVSRSRRGSWGEWFENWEMSNGKPTIVKQGWM